MDRIVERLEERKATVRKDWEEFGCEDNYGGYFATDRAIEIVKGEGEINGRNL